MAERWLTRERRRLHIKRVLVLLAGAGACGALLVGRGGNALRRAGVTGLHHPCPWAVHLGSSGCVGRASP